MPGARASRPQRSAGANWFIASWLTEQKLFALRAHCGRDARGPSKSKTHPYTLLRIN